MSIKFGSQRHETKALIGNQMKEEAWSFQKLISVGEDSLTEVD